MPAANSAPFSANPTTRSAAPSSVQSFADHAVHLSGLAAELPAEKSGGTGKSRPEAGGVLERQLDMLSVIPRAPTWISTAQVAERLEALGYHVDRRTVVRDLNKLSRRFGIERRGEGGSNAITARDEDAIAESAAPAGKRSAPAYAWRWPQHSAGISAPVLTETEALTLVMVREHLADLLPPMVNEALASQFARAEQKLRNLPTVSGGGLKQWTQSVRVVPATQPLLPPRVRHTVREGIYLALATRTQFTGWYRRRRDEAPREYLFNPLGLVLRGQVIYLVATLWDYPDARLYPLHRFERVQREEARRHEPAGFDMNTFLAQQNGLGFATGRGDVCVQLRFRNHTGAHLLETPLSADQDVRECEAGVHEVTATVPDTAQLAWWLLGFGDQVEVLAPAHLREEMRAKAQRMAAMYAP
jgi:predicted DNA-binding transcriptional regulator YafY